MTKDPMPVTKALLERLERDGRIRLPYGWRTLEIDQSTALIIENLVSKDESA